MSRNVAIGIFTILLSFVSLVYGSETDDRMARFLIEGDAQREKLCVDIRCHIIGESHDRRVDGMEIFQRYMVADRGNQQRIDGQKNRLGSKFFPKEDDYEAQLFLQLQNQMLYINYLMPEPELQRFEVRAGITNFRTLTHRVHPFDLATKILPSNDEEVGAFSIRHETVSENELPDGRFRSIVMTKNNLGGREIIFAKDPEWAPLSIKFFLRGQSKMPVGRKVTEKDILSWELFNTTSTEWMEDTTSEKIVPKVIRMDFSFNLREEFREYKFLNWKFGKEVDLSLFKEELFTKQKIPAQVDFIEMRKRFEMNDKL